jgi:hypothetical protein
VRLCACALVRLCACALVRLCACALVRLCACALRVRGAEVQGDSAWDAPAGWVEEADDPSESAPIGDALPAPWQKCYTDSGDVYYYNPSTDESSVSSALFVFVF